MRRFKIAGLALALLAVWLIVKHFSAEVTALRHFVGAVHAASYWGFVLYSLTVATSVLLLLPGLLLCMGGGFLFGTLKGFALFLSGEVLGSTLAFGIARRFFKSRARSYFSAHPKLGFLNESLAAEGWKFIALTRMTPLFPFKLSNYFFGGAGFKFRDFFWGTLLGTLPLAFTLVYLGSVIPDLTGFETRIIWHSRLAKSLTLAIGALSVAGMILLSRRAARNYRQKLSAWEQAKTPGK